MLDSLWGLGTILSDMGAYGGGDSIQVGIVYRDHQIPVDYYLSQNFPNPFNAQTKIKYDLPNVAQVTIDIYNILGRKIETLVNKQQPLGYHQVICNADDVPSGVYFYRIIAGEFSQSRKMLLLK